MLNIFGLREGDNPAIFAYVDKVETYIDTIEMFFRRVPKGLKRETERIHGKKVQIKRCKNAHRVHGYRLIINDQPSAQLLLFLQQVMERHWCRLCRVDVACDFITPSQREANAIAVHLKHCLVLRWRRAGFMWSEGGTVYWCEGRTNRNLVLYADKPARRCDKETPCAHLELRFLNTGSVRRAGLGTVESLIRLDGIGLLSRHVKVLQFDADRFKKRIIKKTLAAERKSFLQNKKAHGRHAFTERYRTRLKQRVASFVERMFIDTAQRFKDNYRSPRQEAHVRDNSAHHPH